MAAIMYPALRAFCTNMTRRKSHWEEAVGLSSFSITHIPFLRGIIRSKEYASPNPPRNHLDTALPSTEKRTAVPGGKALLGECMEGALIPTGLHS
jgi:hypothetical protein